MSSLPPRAEPEDFMDHEREPVGPCLVVMVIGLALMLVVTMALWIRADSDPTLSEAVSTTSTSTTTTVPTTSTIAVIEMAAEATAVAVPVTPRTLPPTTVPPDPCGPEAQAFVNGLPFHVLDPTEVTMNHEELLGHYATLGLAYRAIGNCLGWTQQQQDDWYLAVVTDMSKEAVGCWNVMGGGNVGGFCELGKIGTHEDAGFGQLTRSIYGKSGVLCKHYGICSAAQITATPWSSISSAMLTLMILGPGPWGYDARSRSFHPVLAKMPRQWPGP